tara:strand:- start:302 stop:700 length:399 start_codon:yes stop_codon:yes gene_type:complete
MMSRIQNRILRHIKGELKKQGLSLSPGQMAVVLALNETTHALMGELSRTLDMDSAALTRLVASLETQGLVSREINPANRRQIRVSITPEGKRQAGILIPIVRNANDMISRGFSPEEMAVYNRVNQAILDRFE